MVIIDALDHTDLRTTLVYTASLAESTKAIIEANPINDLL